MCGRFTQRYMWREIHDLYDLTGAARNLQAHYNIAPTDTVEYLGRDVRAAPRPIRLRLRCTIWQDAAFFSQYSLGFTTTRSGAAGRARKTRIRCLPR
jgi:putative SOS response-associated peptidase YedK